MISSTRKVLRAGPVTALLEDGGLRYVKAGGKEIIRGIYSAVRDRNWGTVQGTFRSFSIEQEEDTFSVRFVSEHRDAEVDFVWEGTIVGSADGTIKFSMRGEAKRSFMKNRIGFCILHPLEMAGRELIVETAQGKIIQSHYPALIAPHQPFKDIIRMRMPIQDGWGMELIFYGDTFEMEDQRNWTDASFKTYCSPLDRPYPAEIQKGETVFQQIVLKLTGNTDVITAGKSIEIRQPQINVDVRTAGRKMPAIGLVAVPLGRPAPKELKRLKSLNLGFLRAVVDLTMDEHEWRDALDAASQTAIKLGIGLELELLVDCSGSGLERLVHAVRELRSPVIRIFPFPHSSFVTTSLLAETLLSLRTQAGLLFKVGGGSRTNYAEFGRASLPLLHMEAAGYAINGQTHAFDNASLIESTAAHAVTVKSARVIAGERTLSVGPVTLRPRLNPVASSPEAARAAMDRATHVDERLHMTFGAAWTVSSIKYLADAGADAVSFCETGGPLGVMEAGGAQVYPIFRVFELLGEFENGALVYCESADPLSYDALGLRRGSLLRVLAVNYTDQTIHVQLRMPPHRHARLCGLYGNIGEQDDFANSPDIIVAQLQPYAVICVDAELL